MADASEPEVIRRQMEAQRASLAEKLDTLENRIVRTVDEAREAVADTVQTVKESVQSSVETVRDTVNSSVETVKDTFNVRRQVERHPWAMVGGSIAVGFLAGMVLNRAQRASRSARPSWDYAPVSYTGAAGQAAPQRAEPRAFQDERAAASRFAAAAAASPEPSPPPAPRRPSWVDELTQTFAPEMQKLKGLAIGAAMSVLRDLVTQSIPEHLRPNLEEVLNNVTAKLGGEPMDAHLLDELLPRHQEQPNGEHQAPQLEPQS